MIQGGKSNRKRELRLQVDQVINLEMNLKGVVLIKGLFAMANAGLTNGSRFLSLMFQQSG